MKIKSAKVAVLVNAEKIDQTVTHRVLRSFGGFSTLFLVFA